MNRYLSVLPLILLSMSACTDKNEVVLSRDWQATSSYFHSTEDKIQNIFYKPYNGYVGDPMPFYDPLSKEFKVMYLQEFRPNMAGTYHPFWAVSTKDGALNTSLGELIPTGSSVEQDAALGTGSTIYSEGDKLYYTFYTGNKTDASLEGDGQVVMCATSPDFKTWTKKLTFTLRGKDFGYSSKDFRDPFVFKGDDGLYHMIVSTRQGTKGKLVEFTSKDLKQWQHIGVFMNMMWDRFYECPDIFKMGDWWYLIYSEMHHAVRKVQYFKGRTLSELKLSTDNDAGIWPDDHEGMLDSRAFYAGKTASDGTNRYIWGWCPTRSGQDNTNVGASPNEPEWAGSLVMHKLIQHQDGTLTLGEVPAITKLFTNTTDVKIMAKGKSVQEKNNGYDLSGNTYILFNRLTSQNRISFKVKTSEDEDKFGISFVRGTDSEKYYSVVINPEGATKRKINFEEEGPKGKGFIAGADGYVFDKPSDNTYDVTIINDNSVCVVYINGKYSYTNRIYGIGKNCWSINSYGGNIHISDVKVSTPK